MNEVYDIKVEHNIEEKTPPADLCNHIQEASSGLVVAWSPVLSAWTIVNVLMNKVLATYEKGFCPKCGANIGTRYVSN